MSSLHSTDVFVIGGGPAGLAAAIAARRRGFDVTVADASLPPIDKPCGEGIMPDGIAAARRLGIELESRKGQPFRGIRFVENGARGPVRVEADFPGGHGLGVRRTTLHQLLVEHAADAGVRFHWGSRITGLEDVRARWIIGADGGQSRVRRWAGLDGSAHDSRRYGFRRHYRVAPWSEFMEIHWREGCQLYVTPVGACDICLVLISRDPQLRIDDALPLFPEIAQRLSGAVINPERGGVSATRRLKAVHRGAVALIGDASGSVDAITGEGLCLLFQQALSLAQAMEAGDLSIYAREHRRIGRRPEMMSRLMLLLAQRSGLRRRALRAMAADPRLFARLLATHVGGLDKFDFITNSLSFGWQMVTIR
jgi:flavin-dependent dehydrogenase